ncbi:creatinine amidohydrolase [Streptomyces virginiae]|uniref:Creatinine amidohydrolase n=1 Tax=Streptomyces virginiae TaxID=1961 RepID=A0ABQ3NUV6_STRVG|nr:creatininase family protein [Streptomyces virginiae]MBP2345081.1 creatinine amidohydrolase [Streptomyces virginiae]GGP96284.1 creatinine amidohydrolase [Streptomyces virginiae]GHI16556.1 creatinine amidohydrolase [Streptomyces virginiae]
MHLLPTTTSSDVQEEQPSLAILPVGSFEQHGRYLPLITDTAIACIISQEIASTYSVHLLPPITMSCSHEHAAFPGTVSISAKTLYAMADDIRASLARSGIHKLVIVNGHGGNYVLSNIVQEANVDGPAVSLFPLGADWDRARGHGGLVSDRHADMHAGEIETSILLHAAPELVRDGFADTDHDGGSRPFLLVQGMSAYTETGVIGFPSHATAAKGKAVLASLADSFAGHLEILGLSD